MSHIAKNVLTQNEALSDLEAIHEDVMTVAEYMCKTRKTHFTDERESERTEAEGGYDSLCLVVWVLA